MAVSKRVIKYPKHNESKKSIRQPYSSDNMKLIWVFDGVDNSSKFRFSVDRDDFDAKLILRNVIELSKLTWQEIKSGTHDKGKSKSHFLDVGSVSGEAFECIKRSINEDDYDTIFSLRINNLIRIIGIRKHEKFYVKWYDPKHEFYKTAN